MRLIVPLGGMSTRFGLKKPKWLLTHPDGSYMIEKAIACLAQGDRFKSIHLFLTESVVHSFGLNLSEVYDSISMDHDWSSKVHWHLIEGATTSQLETVAKGIGDMTGPILVKDCDNEFFVPDSTPVFGVNNFILTKRVQKEDDIRRLQQKCFVRSSSAFEIAEMVEKRVVSDEFAVGGYQFGNAQAVVAAWKALKDGSEELYMSHAVNWMIGQGSEFTSVPVADYEDWGTIQEWREYCRSFTNLICDIDGVIFQNGSRAFSPRWGKQEPIMANVEALKRLQNRRTKMIFATARPEKYRDLTRQQLEAVGLRVDALIMGLHHARRLLVNDFGGMTNSWPSAVAVSVERDSDQLSRIIGDFA